MNKWHLKQEKFQKNQFYLPKLIFHDLVSSWQSIFIFFPFFTAFLIDARQKFSAVRNEKKKREDSWKQNDQIESIISVSISNQRRKYEKQEDSKQTINKQIRIVVEPAWICADVIVVVRSVFIFKHGRDAMCKRKHTQTVLF